MMHGIKFREFLCLYNFRYCVRDIKEENTRTIRVYPSKEVFDNAYFEFGINDWSSNQSTVELAEQVLSKEILDSWVSSIHVDDELGILNIYLDEEFYGWVN